MIRLNDEQGRIVRSALRLDGTLGAMVIVDQIDQQMANPKWGTDLLDFIYGVISTAPMGRAANSLSGSRLIQLRGALLSPRTLHQVANAPVGCAGCGTSLEGSELVTVAGDGAVYCTNCLMPEAARCPACHSAGPIPEPVYNAIRKVAKGCPSCMSAKRGDPAPPNTSGGGGTSFQSFTTTEAPTGQPGVWTEMPLPAPQQQQQRQAPTPAGRVRAAAAVAVPTGAASRREATNNNTPPDGLTGREFRVRAAMTPPPTGWEVTPPLAPPAALNSDEVRRWFNPTPGGAAGRNNPNETR